MNQYINALVTVYLMLRCFLTGSENDAQMGKLLNSDKAEAHQENK